MLLFCCLNSLGQQLSENEKITLNGMEYSYVITNAQEKDDYSRYEVTMKCANTSAGMVFRPATVQNGYVKYNNELATFNCTNATGKRLTPKSVSVTMNIFTVPVNDSYTDCKTNKTVTQIKYITAGNAMQPGETISRRAIFIVPKGQKPIIAISGN